MMVMMMVVAGLAGLAVMLFGGWICGWTKSIGWSPLEGGWVVFNNGKMWLMGGKRVGVVNVDVVDVVDW